MARQCKEMGIQYNRQYFDRKERRYIVSKEPVIDDGVLNIGLGNMLGNETEVFRHEVIMDVAFANDEIKK